MKYQVTFEDGQINVYDTKTPFDEFKGQFTSAKEFVQLDGEPVAEVVVNEPAKPKKARKSAE